MTNGEKIKEIFPNIIKYGNILIDDTGALQKNILFDDTWWNAEYKEPTSKNDLGVDAINRATVLHLINDVNNSDGFKDYSQYEYLFDQVDMMPSVTPQEPFINKPCVSSGVCEHDKNKVLDKLRAEIETKYGHCDICEYFEDYDYEENDISEYRPIGNIADVLQIIDKYKAEVKE